MNRDDQSKDLKMRHSKARPSDPALSYAPHCLTNLSKDFLVHLLKAALRRAMLAYVNLREAKIVCSFSFQQGPAKAAKHSNAYRTKAKPRFSLFIATPSKASNAERRKESEAKISFVHCQAAPHAAEQGSALQTLAKIVCPFSAALQSPLRPCLALLTLVQRTKAKIHLFTAKLSYPKHNTAEQSRSQDLFCWFYHA